MPKVNDAHRDGRRQQIVDSASSLFAERGFARTTMADVVSASGLSTGGVYRYFPGKADLVLAVVAGRDGDPGDVQRTESASALLARLAGYVGPGHGSGLHARLVAQIWGDAAVVPEIATVTRTRHLALETHLAVLVSGDAEPTVDEKSRARVALGGWCLSRRGGPDLVDLRGRMSYGAGTSTAG